MIVYSKQFLNNKDSLYNVGLYGKCKYNVDYVWLWELTLSCGQALIDYSDLSEKAIFLDVWNRGCDALTDLLNLQKAVFTVYDDALHERSA